jgi:hypothetical protein
MPVVAWRIAVVKVMRKSGAARERGHSYNREGVKFRDSGNEIERNIAKCQICHTLPERSVGTS